MNLKNLVPPPDLCKKIPAGKFADSALVWTPNRYDDKVFHLIRRDEAWRGDIYPAPTLQEIFFSIEKDHRCYLPNVYITPENALQIWLDHENRIKAKGETET